MLLFYTESNGELDFVDLNNPQGVAPLEPWFGVVIQLADGQHTLEALIRKKKPCNLVCNASNYPKLFNELNLG